MEINNITFDHQFYRNNYKDLRKFSDADLEEHFRKYGIKEGRMCSYYSVRENLIAEILNKRFKSLEIGPFFAPALKGKDIKYFDALDTNELIERAKKLNEQDAGSNININNIPKINYSSIKGDLSIIDDTFEIVFSSHCIEHQPNLIKHLNDVSKTLCDGGRYFILIPDKRYCFDHYLSESNIAEIYQADYENRTKHSLRNVIEHRSLLTHNDSIAHWNGNNGVISNEEKIQRLKSAVEEYKLSKDLYIDVHAWQFTPSSFSNIMHQLKLVDKFPFKTKKVFATPHGRNEFVAILEK